MSRYLERGERRNEMSDMTRDDVLDIMLECDPHVCCKCALEPQKHWCYEIKESALNSLRDDYNAEIEKNKLLEAEIERLKSAIRLTIQAMCHLMGIARLIMNDFERSN
jgi:hypothetical protein